MFPRSTGARLRQAALRAAAVLLVTCAVLLLSSGWWLPFIGHWIDQPARLASVDAIVVLGGGNPPRILHALSLYKRGLAKEIWHTGNVRYPNQALSSAEMGAQIAVQQGVPREAMFLLASTSTWEDGQVIAALAAQRETRSILVVTDWTHSRRALQVIRTRLNGSDISIYYDHPPQETPGGPDTWWQNEFRRHQINSELLKIVFYWIYYGVTP